MSIDGVGSPAGATHCGADTDHNCEAWYRVEDGVIVSYVCVGDHPYVLSPAQAGSGHYHDIDELVEIWTGQGIPPVGVVCEGLNGCNQWVRCMVLHHTLHIPPKAIAVYGELEDGLASFFGWRPIRTPEQIAAEEKIADLNHMIRCIKDHPNKYPGVTHLSQLKIQEDACVDLYEAGYRKQVTE